MSLDVRLYSGTPCPTCGTNSGVELYSDNITHNLTNMASAAGIYEVVWRPEESGIERAADLTEPLTLAVREMRARPEHFEQFDSPNGWGLYENFLPWLERYLAACRNHPDAHVEVSR